VGDSRLYRFGEDGLAQITVDHSHVQDLVDHGLLDPALVGTHPRRNIVTRALGVGEIHEPDFWLFPVEPGERFLLCSDGLSGELDAAAIASVLEKDADPQDAADHLIEAVLQTDARDNVSVVVVDVLDVSPRDDLVDAETASIVVISDEATPATHRDVEEDTQERNPRGPA
jgi:protein phosphatase